MRKSLKLDQAAPKYKISTLYLSPSVMTVIIVFVVKNVNKVVILIINDYQMLRSSGWLSSTHICTGFLERNGTQLSPSLRPQMPVAASPAGMNQLTRLPLV